MITCLFSHWKDGACMNENRESKRFVFRTKGICPPEIHFQLRHGALEDLRFVGGGCTGTAHLVARLLKGRLAQEVLPSLDGIVCHDDTSCAHQLQAALKAALEDRLSPADSFRIHKDAQQHHRIGLIAAINGDTPALTELLEAMKAVELDAIYCLGNLTGLRQNNKKLLKLIKKEKIPTVLGEMDWRLAQGNDSDDLPEVDQKTRDWLFQSPHVISFKLGAKKGMAFFGGYIQDIPGYSDFEPFALEMNMVCGLTDYMRDRSVIPALEAMIPQFEADIILFSQAQSWNHWQVAGKDFISLGPAIEPGHLAWGLLEVEKERVHFRQVHFKSNFQED